MNPVNRRFSLLAVVLSVLLLSACAGGSSSALSYGGQSISHDELAELVRVAGPTAGTGVLATDTVATQSADLTRVVSSTWLVDAATVNYLEMQGFELSEADRGDAEQIILQAVGRGEIGEVVDGTLAWEFFIRRIWISGFNAELQADPNVTDFLVNELESAEVASNIGVWDPDAGQVVPPIIGAS